MNRVEKMQKDLKVSDEYDDDMNSDFSNFRCYCCELNFAGSTQFGARFRYKPGKVIWRQEKLCIVCFLALQNPLFKLFSEGCYGYDGILEQWDDKLNEGKHKSCNGIWYYKDLRDLRDLSDWDDIYKDTRQMLNDF